MIMQTIGPGAAPAGASPFVLPDGRALLRLFVGGLAGLILWEVWAKVLTPPVAGFPLEPPELVRILIQRWTGVMTSLPVATALHWLIGVVGYPLAYWFISRGFRRWAPTLDIAVWAIFTLFVGWLALTGGMSAFIALFWLLVTGLSATRLVNSHRVLADALSWGSFTWFNALGLMAPLAGQSFLLLADAPALSFMSWAGHVVYGAVAVLVFEALSKRA